MSVGPLAVGGGAPLEGFYNAPLPAPPEQRTFIKWWNWVYFTDFALVYARFGGPSAFSRIISIGDVGSNGDHRFINILDMPPQYLDAALLAGSAFITALGVQGTSLFPFEITDEYLAMLAAWKNYHDPFRDPAYN